MVNPVKAYISQKFRASSLFFSFAFHRLGLLRKITGGFHADIPRTSLITCTMNCSACELAWLGCPVGVIQKFATLKIIPLYIFGWLGMIGSIFGRSICGWFCPFGMVTEIVDKACSRNYIPPRGFKLIKYINLVLLFIAAWFTLELVWCKFLCLPGIIFGVLPYWLTWKTVTLTWFIYHLSILTIYLAISFQVGGRAWCQFMCPLGALFGIFNFFSLITLNRKMDTCINCSKCEEACQMNVSPVRWDALDVIDCVACGKCVNACPKNCLSIGKRSTDAKIGLPNIKEELIILK